MLRFLRKPDIPFSREDANRLMPWVVGLMVCLVGLFLAIAISIGTASNAMSSFNINHFQVYIPYQEEGMDKNIKVVQAALETFNSVNSVKQISRSEIKSLIEPWTGSMLELDELPLPVVLEATLRESANRQEQLEKIKAKLSKLDVGIQVEHYDEWVRHLWRFTDALRLISLSMAALLIAGLVIMVMLAARTSLKLHYNTVLLLHNIGARDDYILQQFVINGVWLVLRGAVAGTIVSIIVTVILSALSSEMQSPLLPQLTISPIHMVMYVMLPIVSALVAYIAVRTSVQSMIEHMN